MSCKRVTAEIHESQPSLSVNPPQETQAKEPDTQMYFLLHLSMLFEISFIILGDLTYSI